MELAEFLKARLDEDEQVARAATPGPWTQAEEIDGWRAGRMTTVKADGRRVVTVDQTRQHHEPGEANTAHIARHNPARVLAEVEAKRRIVGLHDRQHVADKTDCGIDIWDRATATVYDLCDVLCLLTLTYAQHEQFREEWRP